MFTFILELLATIIIFIISKLGYAGIVLAMAIESACIPLPSEIIMPFSGFLVGRGLFDFWLVSLAGGVGCLFGSLLAFWVGSHFGEDFVRHLIRKYGKFVLVFEYELDEAKHWFAKRGDLITFTSRLLPVVRTFISLPAGISGMNIKTFSFYTFTGSLIWSAVLTYLGKVLGANWNILGSYFHKFDIFIFLGLVGITFFYVYHKLKKNHWYQRNQKS